MSGIINWDELWKVMRSSSAWRRVPETDTGFWDRYAKQCNESAMQNRERTERELSAIELDSDCSVLDIGSGVGRLAIPIASRVATYHEEIMGLVGFVNMEAVETGRVHIMGADIVTSPVYPVGLAYQAKWFHPELFEDMDPEAIHQEYIDEFCGIDYDVAEHGVFVYPQLE